MQIIADLHIHSKYSRATSKALDLFEIEKWAKIKGVDLIATADFTHPVWFKHLQDNLVETSSGIYQIKNSKTGINFFISTEISCIYSKNDKVRRQHILIFSPSLEVAERLAKQLDKVGKLKSDGRPILRLDAKELLKICLSVDEKIMVIPAHAWTPWFSVFGSKSGFDSLKDCYEELTPHIYAIETGLSCYDENTEVLTDNGWKRFKKINYCDKICTLNSTSNEITFQNPINIQNYKYKGKMYRLKTKRVDLFVTPNHKLFYSHCNFRKQPTFSLKKAEDMFNKSKRFKKDGIWNGKNKEYFILPEVKIKHGSRYYKGHRNKQAKQLSMKPWLKFFGFWIAEGWTSQGKDGDYNICLSNKNYKLIYEMRRILENFGYKTFYSKNLYTLRVRDYQLFNYLRQFGKSNNKFIPSDIKSLSKELLEILLKYYIKGDGHIYGRTGKGLSATTISVRLRDDLQEIALKIGMSAYYKLHNKKGTPFKNPGHKYKKIYKQSADSWVIYFIRKNIHTVLPSIVKKFGYIESWINFNGQVYCVTVPNHVIYIRRNGIPVWCGNSDPEMNWQWSALDNIALISNSDAHSGSTIAREANVFNLEELAYNEIYQVIKNQDKKKFLYTIEFFPEEGKYHLDGHRSCNVCLTPEETEKNKNICPKCKKPLTIGVLNRVEKLADRQKVINSLEKIPFKSLVPLSEIIAEYLKQNKNTKKVQASYLEFIGKGENELNILINLSEAELKRFIPSALADGILRVRQGKVNRNPGYDGEYGKIKIFNEKELEKPQKTLF